MKESTVKPFIVFIVLTITCITAFSVRLFAVIRFESIIHEFDPWFNYRATAYMVKHGFYDFLNWFDNTAWYPLGRIVGGTVYPGLMLTSGTIHYVLSLLNIPVHIREVCVFLAPLFSGFTAIATYLLTKELWNEGAGLFAACFIGIVPGYISRSVAGSYDNEGIAIFALMFTYFLWIKSLKTGSICWSIFTALSYFYMVSAWGGYVFIINLIPLHVFFLLLINRFSQRVYVAYNTFFIVGLLCSMQVPFVGFQPIKTSEHMASVGVFGLLQIVGLFKFFRGKLTKSEFQILLLFLVAISAGIGFLLVTLLTWAGFVAPWSGRFYSLWDTGYAKIHIPIIASVSEHQPTTWFSFFFDLHVLVCMFPVGLWHTVQSINDERVFIVLYALSAVYFAGVMIRLMLTLTPCVCILAAIGFSRFFELYLVNDDKPDEPSAESLEKISADKLLHQIRKEGSDIDNGITHDKASSSKKTQERGRSGKYVKAAHTNSIEDEKLGLNFRSIILVAVVMTLMLFAIHCTWVTSNAYSSPSVVLASYSGNERHILDDFREAYYWLWQNTPEDANVMSWWDYGYQIAGMANRSTLVDNNTWNNTHIAMVGAAMSSNETTSYEIMTKLNVDYVLVIFGGVIGYSGDDINKFLWMVRIAEGENLAGIREKDYFTDRGEFRVDAGGAPTLLNCLMYKLSYYRFGSLRLDPRSPSGFDRTRSAEIGNKNFGLTYLEESFTSEHWLVRIYRVKKPDEFNRPRIPYKDRKIKIKHTKSKKQRKTKVGSIKSQKSIIKGQRK